MMFSEMDIYTHKILIADTVLYWVEFTKKNCPKYR